MTASQYRQARALIEDPAHWCRGAMAVDATGRSVYPNAPTAVAWCALGACCVVTDRQHIGDLEFHALAEALFKLFQRPVVGANDWRGLTHRGLLRAFDLAILIAEHDEREKGIQHRGPHT